MSDAVVGGTLLSPALVGGRKRRGVPVKTLKRVLKKAGLKTTGKKATLTRRVKKAHLKMRGGEVYAAVPGVGKVPAEEVKKGGEGEEMEGARRRRSRKSRGFKLW